MPYQKETISATFENASPFYGHLCAVHACGWETMDNHVSQDDTVVLEKYYLSTGLLAGLGSIWFKW